MGLGQWDMYNTNFIIHLIYVKVSSSGETLQYFIGFAYKANHSIVYAI